MQPGMYVRIPIKIKEVDVAYPRTFALAQILEVDSLAETVKIRLHDLNNCRAYYNNIFKRTEFSWDDVVRCKAPKGTNVVTPSGEGTILSVTRQKDNGSFYIYHVSINGQDVLAFPENEIAADFTAFDMDPADMLMQYEFQHPSWFACRNVVSSTMHVLNNAVYGFKVLAGCRVFLLPHQVVTILRCLENTPVRYMLADEVGLGKTIEACSIVKIMQERNPSLRVLYVLPTPLKDQWKYELMNKFAIEAVPYREGTEEDRHILVTPQELRLINMGSLLQNHFDIVIVDETHNLLGDEDAYQRILRLSSQIENILLLSATPIQDRKEEFLRLLRLLEPKQYGNMELAYFSELVERQLDIQRELYMLMGDIQSYGEYAESIYDQLQSLAQELQDQRLQSLVNTIDLNAEDKGLETAYQAAAYISEHYRLERHVIRNRRALLKERMAVRQLIEQPYQMVTLNELYGEADAVDSLIEWLSSINNHTDSFVEKLVRPLLEAAFSSPWALQGRLHVLKSEGISIPEGLMDTIDSWTRAADRELLRVDELLDENPDEICGRLVRCLDYLEQETDVTKNKPYKVLVFTRYKETLERFLQVARTRFDEKMCRAFYSSMTEEELQDSAEDFQDSSGCRILVCDELGGEGRNFQMADMVVHLDTPWTANMLEQRIGRLDRLGRNPENQVVSVVFYAENTIEEQLVHLWKDGMGIYNQSLSGLEIISGEVTNNIVKALKNDVREGVSLAIPLIQEETSRMREAVEEEQFYDMASMLYRPLTVAVERMLDMYQGKEDDIFSEAMDSWADQAGFKPNSINEGTKNILKEFRAEKFSPASSTNALMIPPSWDKYTINPRFNRMGRRIVGTFNRALAIQREDLLFYAPGDPIFDTITENAINCYRGRVGAIKITQASFSFKGLVFIWNIEPDIQPLIDNNLDSVVLAQFRTFLPLEQIVTIYPINGDYSHVSARSIEEILKQRNLMKKATHLGERGNPNSGFSPIEDFMERYPEHQWVSWIKKARKECHEMAYQLVMERWDYDTALEEANRIVSARLASDQYFDRKTEGNENLKSTYEAILAAIKNYRVILDASVYMEVKENEYR
ncbi:SNF2-related protein [Brevibacillus dissolubilis]|uniref:SNF2-related protein n=1 Tax=Brevibacillus dissolubilis TaxID=1844116 RepID=UPI0011171B1C|nr:helicase-related protein [Brevibacillus dissolubilis]